MLSVLTITYQRSGMLEEAIMSYISQDYIGESEMVVLNDSPLVEYQFTQYPYPSTPYEAWFRGAGSGYMKQIRIINHPTRFPNIGRKLEYGYKACKGDFVYRLDDDDALHPTALTQVQSWIDKNPAYDVYRASHFYQIENNQFTKISESINTGNVLSREYINRLTFPDKNADEDLDIVFSPGVKMFTAPNTKTMLYRWRGDGTHISNHINKPNEERLNFMPTNEHGIIVLKPHFDHDYYSQLPHE